MTQSKTGAFPTGRIPQLIGKAALAASVVVGSFSLLSAGGAQADSVVCPPAPQSLGTEGLYKAELIYGPTLLAPLGSADCSLSSPVGGDPQKATLDTNFNKEISSPGEGYVWYKISRTDGNLITHARIDSDFDSLSGSVQKEIFESITGTGSSITGVNKVWDYTSENGNPNPAPPAEFLSLSTAFNHIYVKDTYKILPGGQLDNFTNTFVPGPLPILGAGAAFGFSRKLRSRIKAARLS